ncbi:MAG: hypothetical protein ACHQAV_04860 [Solirubrobacterales bacterium]
MRNRPRHSASSIDRLRLAIDCLPVATREAMLAGVRGNQRIIGGAYVDGEGGVCPMLAAHRGGGRTDFLSFAKSWDRFTRASGKAQAATAREVRTLIAQLEASLMDATGMELDQAISEHRELRSRRLRGARRRLDVVDPAGAILARRLRGSSARRFVGDKLARATERRLAAPVSSRG